MFVNSGNSVNIDGAIIKSGTELKKNILDRMSEERIEELLKKEILCKKKPVLNEKKDGGAAEKDVNYNTPGAENSPVANTGEAKRKAKEASEKAAEKAENK